MFTSPGRTRCNLRFMIYRVFAEVNTKALKVEKSTIQNLGFWGLLPHGDVMLMKPSKVTSFGQPQHLVDNRLYEVECQASALCESNHYRETNIAKSTTSTSLGVETSWPISWWSLAPLVNLMREQISASFGLWSVDWFTFGEGSNMATSNTSPCTARNTVHVYYIVGYVRGPPLCPEAMSGGCATT
jgi:hypothetical protein